MGRTPTSLSIDMATRDRLWRLKTGPGRSITYDKIINEALDALEEKTNEPRLSPSTV